MDLVLCLVMELGSERQPHMGRDGVMNDASVLALALETRQGHHRGNVDR